MSFYTMHEWSNTDKRYVIVTSPTVFDLEPASLRPGAPITIKSQIGTILTAPVATAATPSTTGGTLATGTYYYKITAINANGESLGSNEESAAVTGPTGSVALTWNSVSGATSYRVYRGTTAGGENVYYTVGAVTTYTDTNAAVSGSATPPTVAGVVVTAAGSDLIDGAATLTMSTDYDWVTLFSDGKNWNVVSRAPSAVAA